MIANIEARRLLKNYAVPILGTLVFVVVFIGVWLSHQSALASVRDLAKSNPLIASSSGKLISRDDENKGKLDDQEGDTLPNSTPTDATPSGKTSSSSGSVSQQSTGASSGSSGTSPTSQPQFAVSLGAIQYSKTTSNVLTGLLGIVLGCSIDHQFKLSVSGMNGPGTIKYQWIRSSGGDGDVEQKSFPAGDSTIELVHKWTTSSSGDYWVELQLSTPSVAEKRYSFKHQC